MWSVLYMFLHIMNSFTYRKFGSTGFMCKWAFSINHKIKSKCMYLLFTRKNTTQFLASELIKLLFWKGQQSHCLDWCTHCPTFNMACSWFIKLPGKYDLTSLFCEYFYCALLLIGSMQIPQRSLYFLSHLLYIYVNCTAVSIATTIVKFWRFEIFWSRFSITRIMSVMLSQFTGEQSEV